MQTQERRAAILARLQTAETPVSAGALARQFAVSRQVIVNDVAMLRAGGADVVGSDGVGFNGGSRGGGGLAAPQPVAGRNGERRRGECGEQFSFHKAV